MREVLHFSDQIREEIRDLLIPVFGGEGFFLPILTPTSRIQAALGIPTHLPACHVAGGGGWVAANVLSAENDQK